MHKQGHRAAQYKTDINTDVNVNIDDALNTDQRTVNRKTDNPKLIKKLKLWLMG